MADDADRAGPHIDSVVQAGIDRLRNAPTMPAIGRCYYCDDDIPEHHIFCSSECSIDWRYLQDRKKVNGK